MNAINLTASGPRDRTVNRRRQKQRLSMARPARSVAKQQWTKQAKSQTSGASAGSPSRMPRSPLLLPSLDPRPCWLPSLWKEWSTDRCGARNRARQRCGRGKGWV